MKARIVGALALVLAGCSLPVMRSEQDRWVIQAEELARAGEYRGALETYRRALDNSTRNAATERALVGLARLYVAPENPHRDYRRALETFDRLLKEYPESASVGEARAWRELLSTFLGQREEVERTRQEAERARQESQRQRDEAERARQEVQRQRDEIERARQEVQRIRQDLERLKQIELELERQRRR